MSVKIRLAAINGNTARILMALTALFWAGAFIAGKIAVLDFPPFTLTFLRFLFATLLVFPTLVRSTRYWKLRVKDIPTLMLMGLVGMFGYHVLFFTALRTTSAMNSSLICGTSPLVTAAIASTLAGERFGLRRLAAAILAFSGLLVAVFGGEVVGMRTIGIKAGDGIMLLAVVCQASHSVLCCLTRKKFTALYATAYSFIVCLLLLLPFVVQENPLQTLGGASAAGWLAVLYMAIFASGVGCLLQQAAIRSIGASRTMAFVNLVPVFSLGLSALILQEVITPVKIIGTIMVIAGVWINSVKT